MVMGRFRSASRCRRRRRYGQQNLSGEPTRAFPEFEGSVTDEPKPPRRFSAGDIFGCRATASHPAVATAGAATGNFASSRDPWMRPDNALRGGSDEDRPSSNEAQQVEKHRYEPRASASAETREVNHGREVPLSLQAPATRSDRARFAVSVPALRLGPRRRRASWSSPRDPRRTHTQAGCEGDAASGLVPVSPLLQLHWEMQGVSGRAYQSDGNPSLYRKKKLAARRRLSKNKNVRLAIERGWWPYLPLRWVALNDHHVMKILPRQGYTRLFTAMYATLVPTAGETEAEETASWEYVEDARGLPIELGQAGLSLEAFSSALFSVADNWTETVLAEEYIRFLDLLWKRVRPDLLFPPPPRGDVDKPPPLFSTAMTKDGKPSSRPARRKKGKQNDRKSRGANQRPRSTDTGVPSSPAGSTAAWDGVERGDGAGGGTGADTGGRGIAKMNFYAKFDRPHPPPPAPAPRTPEGLLVLRIPGFRPRDAQRAAWVGNGGYIDPGARKMLRGEVVKRVQEKGAERDKPQEGRQLEKGEEQEEQGGEEPGWKQRRSRRLLAAGVIELGDRNPVSPRTTREERGPNDGPEKAEELDSVWDFAAMRFPLNPRERDAFVLFVERKKPQYFDSLRPERAKDTDANNTGIDDPDFTPPGEGAQQSLSPGDPSLVFGATARIGHPSAVVRRYRSMEDSWARARRKNIPKRVLEDLLAAWRKEENGLTPAEYGAAVVGPCQRASFLEYAIANGWGTRAGGVHSRQTLDGIAEGWRLGSGFCPEMDVLWEILEDLLWEAADDAVDQAFSDGVDLYTIPHRLLRDPQGVPQAQSRSQAGLHFRQEPGGRRRVSTAPASTAPTTKTPRPGRGREVTSAGSSRWGGGFAGGFGVDAPGGTPIAKGGKGPEWLGGDGGGGGGGGGGEGTGPAGRLLLQGERVSGSVRQGQAAFFKTPCPTERGACLEITLISNGVNGGRGAAASDTRVTAISLYAVQAPHRPLRLSCYHWISRGKAYHRLVLNWKGGSSGSSQRPGDGGQGYPGNPVHASLSHAVVPPPWGGLTGHAPPSPANASASAPATSSAPIHIAVVCPEAPPPLAVPIAPAFGGTMDDLLGEDRQAGKNTGQNGRGADAVVGTGLPLRDVLGGGVATRTDEREAQRGVQAAAERRNRRARFFVGVRVLGPPRVVLEGRWYCLPLRRDTGTRVRGQHCLTAYATLRLPTPLKITTWWTDKGRGPAVISREEGSSTFESVEGEPGFVDSQILVTLQVRPSDPKEGVDVYCGASPRPGPEPAEHTWWMPAGGGSDANSARPQTARDPPRRRTGADAEGIVEKETDTGRGGNENVHRTSSLLCSEAGNGNVFRASDQVALGHPGSDGTTAAEEEEERAGGVAGGSPAARKEDFPQQASMDDAGGGGWNRMTVPMPRDHAGAFHVGVFGRTHRKPAVGIRGAATKEEAIDIKAAVWCPVVTVPPRTPLCGRLPHGQRRELLWSIGRDELVFEAKVEITRAIEDPFTLQQLEFAQGFQRRFCPSKDVGDRVPVLGSGRACQGLHTRPFLLASRRTSPSRHDYTWRGVNVDGAVEVLYAGDGATQVFTRYTETLKVGPSDERYGVGKYRLALEAGATDCSFRLLFWNRAATAKDRVSLPVRLMPTPVTGAGDALSRRRREREEAEGKTPSREGDSRGDAGRGETRGGLSSTRCEASAVNNRRGSSSIAPAPSSPSFAATNEPRGEQASDEGGLASPAAAVTSPRSPGAGRSPATNRRPDVRPATCDAAIPSAICTIAGGVAATCVSPRGRAGGCGRQLVVAEQYLNRSLLVPVPPREQAVLNNDHHGRGRAFAAEEGKEAVRPTQVLLAGSGRSFEDLRPRTSPAASGLGETVRGTSLAAEGGNIWRSSSPGGDHRRRSDLSRLGVSSRPLTSSRTASVGKGGPRERRCGSTPRHPRERVVVVASPKRERSPKPCEGRGITPGCASPVRREPAQAAVAPVCGGGGGCVPGAEIIGEVGYTVSSASALGGNACYTEGGCHVGARIKGAPHPQATSSGSEPVLTLALCDATGEHSSAAAAAKIPKLQLGRLE